MDNHLNLDLTRVSKELQFIFVLLKERKGFSEEVLEELCSTIDWDVFVELAMHHRVYPMLYTRLKTIDETLIPSFVIQRLLQQYKRNTFQMLHLTAVMEQVNQVFSKNDIRLLFLKGPVLAGELYGDISLRTSSDLDFLVPIEDLPNAEKLLLELGYEKDDYIETVLNDWTWRHHHVTYIHPQKGIKLEIHWRLHPGPGKEPSFQELWERKSVSSLSKSNIYLLGKEDSFLFLVAHGARHGWSRLRWLMDIHQLLKQKLNLQQLLDLLKTYQLLHVGGQAVILTSQILNTDIKEMKTLLGKRSSVLAQEAIFYLENLVNLHTDPVPEEVSTYHKRHLFSLMSTWQKVIFVLSFLHPYPEDAKTLPLPKKLHFLYFPLRPFLCMWRRTRKQAIT